MNPRDVEQLDVFRRYLIEQAEQSSSRLLRNQILRWVERVDAARDDKSDEREGRDEGLAGLKKAA